jgi:exodeoxyribonuclease III
MRLYSWNTNGIRAAVKHGMLDWLKKNSPDILCVQETKVSDPQSVLSEEILSPSGYYSYWNWPAAKKGYSGVAIYTKEKPLEVLNNLGVSAFDTEGRILIAHYPDFSVLNAYFPNGKKNKERLDYKMGFYDAFLDVCNMLVRDNKKLVMCGDFNTAHKEIDLAHPRENEGVSGFLPMERAWIDKYVSSGYHDTLRMFNGGPGIYTWWDMKTRARERNIGWRIDYVFVSDNFKNRVKNAFVEAGVFGSDHCPAGIEFDV